jgi:rhamnulose-1-phosphate aldolase
MSDVRFRQPGFEDSLEQARRVAEHLWRKGWGERNAGNLSIDVTGLVESGPPEFEAARVDWCERGRPLSVPAEALAGVCLLIGARGSRAREIARDPASRCGVIRFTADGRGYEVLWPGTGPAPFVPTSELTTHAAIHASLHARRAPERAVLHTHPDELIAMSHEPAQLDDSALNRRLWQMHPETIVTLPDGVGLVRYLLPGSLEQGLASAAALERHQVALWEKHGAVAAGADLDEAFDRIDTLNKSAKLYLACRSAGFEPEGLTAAQLDDLLRHFLGRSLR